MKRIFAGALCAVAFVGFSGTASAVPIYFNFTGSVTQAFGSVSGLEGTAVSGGFSFETDRLTRLESPDVAMVQFYDDGVAEPYAFLSFGTRNVVFPVYPQGNTVNAAFLDTVCPDFVIRCNAAANDGFELFARSSDIPFSSAPDFVGTYSDSILGVNVATGDDFIDWTTAAPVDITSLPLQSMFGYYSDTLYTCTGETLCAQERNEFAFTIDSVTRGVGPRAVPEPGMFGLLAGAGLMGLLFTRRRAAPLQHSA